MNHFPYTGAWMTWADLKVFLFVAFASCCLSPGIPVRGESPPLLSVSDLALIEQMATRADRDYYAIFDKDAKAGWCTSWVELVEDDGRRRLRYHDEEEIVGRYFGELQTQQVFYFFECELDAPFCMTRMHERTVARGFEKSVEVVPDPKGKPGDYVAHITEGGVKRTAALEFSELAGERRALNLKDVYLGELMAMRGDPPGTIAHFIGMDTMDLEVQRFTLEVVEPIEGQSTDTSRLSLSMAEQGPYLAATVNRAAVWLDYEYRNSLRYQKVGDEALAKADLGDYEIPGMEEVLSSQPLGDPGIVHRMTVLLDGDWRDVMPDTDLQTVSYDETSDRTKIEVSCSGKRGEKVTENERRIALRATGDLPVNDPKLKHLAEEIVEGSKTDREKVERLSAWVTRMLNYEIDLDPLSVQEALAAQRGDCSEHAALFATMARSVGLPARDISGWVYAGDDYGSFGYHAWNEVAIDGYWKSLDCTWNEQIPNASHLRCDLSDGDPEFWERVEGGLVVEVVDFESDAALALSEAERLIAAHPDEAAWYIQRGVLREEAGAALEDLQRGVELAPDVAEFRETLAYKFWDAGDPDKAVAAMEKAVELSPENTDYWQALCDLRYEMEDFAGALEAADRLVELQPNSAEHHVERAYLLLALENYRGIDKAVERAFALWPGMASAHQALGLSFYYREKYREASEQFAMAAAADPSVVDYWSSLLTSLGEERPSAERERRLRKTLEDAAIGLVEAPEQGLELLGQFISEGHAELLLSLLEGETVDALLPEEDRASGRLGFQVAALVSLQRFEDSVIITNAAIEEAPESAELHLLLARLEIQLEHWPQSIAALKKATQLDPTNVEVPVTLAYVYQKTGKRKKRKQVLAAALESWTDDLEQREQFLFACESMGFQKFANAARKAELPEDGAVRDAE